MLPRVIVNVVRKDWLEFKGTILGLAAAMLLPVLGYGRAPDFTKGAMAGLAITVSYAFAYLCFSGERQSGKVRTFELVLAKVVSAGSMALFATLVPASLLRDVGLLFLMGSFVVFLTTVCTSFAVLSNKPWAPVIPVWIVLIGFMPIRGVHTLLQYLDEHRTWWALLALLITPLIAIATAWWFERTHSRN